MLLRETASILILSLPHFRQAICYGMFQELEIAGEIIHFPLLSRRCCLSANSRNCSRQRPFVRHQKDKKRAVRKHDRASTLGHVYVLSLHLLGRLPGLQDKMVNQLAVVCMRNNQER